MKHLECYARFELGLEDFENRDGHDLFKRSDFFSIFLLGASKNEKTISIFWLLEKARAHPCIELA